MKAKGSTTGSGAADERLKDKGRGMKDEGARRVADSERIS